MPALLNLLLPSLAASSCPPADPTLWRRRMVAGAASLTVTLTVPGVITKRDHLSRAEPRSAHLASKAAWCAVRLADPLLCGSLVVRHTRCASKQPSARSRVLVAMAAVSGVRHALWAALVLKKPWPLPLSLLVGVGNSLINWLHCRASLEREDDRGTEPMGPIAVAGVLCFLAGSYLESASELQRLAFRRAHAGQQLCTTGLWRYATHVNYLGYVLWRSGIGMVSAPPWSVAYGAAHLLDFRLRAVPLLRAHMRKRYGQEWEDYAARTAAIVPGIL